MFQFIRSGVGRGKVGKNENVSAMHRYTIETPLIQIPTRPRENLHGRSGSPFHLLMNMHEILMMYEDSSAHVPNDATELKAMEEPMLMSESPMAMTNETMTLFSGMSQPGRTRDKNALKGTGNCQ